MPIVNALVLAGLCLLLGVALGLLLMLRELRAARRVEATMRSALEDGVLALDGAVVVHRQHEAKISGLVDGCKSLELQRNTWENKYWECALEFGQAQELLLRERESLSEQYFRATGKQPVRNGLIDRITGHFKRKFSDPARARAVQAPNLEGGSTGGNSDGGEQSSIESGA